MDLNRNVTKINIASLKMDVGFGNGLPERKETNIILVRKPDKQVYIRVHPDPLWQLRTAVLEIKSDNEMYLVASELWEELRNEIKPKIIISAITRQDTFFLWPIALPNESGWLDPWSRSAVECAKKAQDQWVRVQSNKDAGVYEVNIAENQDSFPEPVWPVIGFEKLLMTAFKDHYIDSINHPVVQRLRGVL